ncbi:MAG: SufS family cysteine desulfurase [Oryzomonas sp.]|jgi:cysteine desulfurase/selenocysteine lyase
MNDITPELIASIATRLYNEIPGANLVPKTEADTTQGIPEAGSLPGAPQQVTTGYFTPPISPGGSSIPGLGAVTPNITGIPSLPAASPDGFELPGLSGLSPSWPGSSGGAGNSAESFTLPGAAGLGSHGYRVPNPKAIPSDTVGVPGLSGISPSWPVIPGETQTTPESFTAPGGAAHSTDGLSAFVQKIRAGHIRNEDGTCRAGHDPDLLQRLFAAKSAPDGGARPLDIPAIRKDFPALNQKVHGKQLAWMDNGATTQKPQSVIDAVSRFYENDNSNIHRGAHTLAARATDAFEQARQKVQTFLGASSSKDIVFVRGTTEGINLVAQTYGRKFLQPGDEIVLSTLEHHANIVPWQMIAKEKGAVIRVIPVNDRGEVMLEAYEALLGPRTKLVALTQASNSLGTILPVAEMTHAAKRYNARVLIDGAQSVSHMPVNMQEIGCDFFVFSGHKIFAPTGIGAVYIHEQLHEILPPWQGGGNMIKNVTFEETTYNETPAKFEAGTPNIADAVGLGAALDYVNRLGLVNTGNYEHKLLEYATELLSKINGVRILGSAREKVAVISFVVKDRKTEEVGRLLDQEGIAVRAGHHCAQPSLRRFGVESSVRPSFAFYNTYDEIDRLADAVRKITQN